MVREVISSLDYSIFAEISLVAFVLVFAALSIRTLFADRATMAQRASIALEDGKEVTKP